MTLAQGVRHQLVQNLAGGDGQVVRHYDLLQQIMGYSSIGIGAATGSWSKHLYGVKHTLEDIERFHKLSLAEAHRLRVKSSSVSDACYSASWINNWKV